MNTPIAIFHPLFNFLRSGFWGLLLPALLVFGCGRSDLKRQSSCADEVINGTETDVDCGGSCEPCALDLLCLVNGDCASAFCNPEGICACPDGFEASDGNCVDIDECAGDENNCDANATCTNTEGSFTCACNEGFHGDGVECVSDLDCALGETECDANAACIEEEAGSFCHCNDGYDGDGVTCADLDECTLNTDNCDANATCANTPGSFECTCNDGYDGDGVTCADLDECTLNTDNCDANATCANTPGSFTCTCNGGYDGDGVTCADLDECTLNTDNCDANATCANTPGSFTCTCNGGYSGDGVTCADLDECTLNTDNCDANANCANTPGSFTCTCNGGYSGSGVTCADLDECTLNTDNCDANATCANTPGSFTCTCNGGYSGDGVTCADLDECALNTDNCDANATCANTIGSFTCTCNGGYSGSGVTCADLDECVLNTDNCDANATCANTIGSFTCTCNGGYSGSGVTCTDLDECALNTDNCDANATCANTIGSFTCTCNGGYSGSGVTCTDLDECALNTDNCDANATCANTPGSFTCTCTQHSVDINGDGTLCQFHGSCREILDYEAVSLPDGLYPIDAGAGVIQVTCDMTTDGGAGYTMLRINNASLGNDQTAYAAACAAVGLEIIVPRTRNHAFAIETWNGGVPNLVNVFPKYNGASGLSEWTGRCQGAPCTFWLSDSNNSDCFGFEPNGDNDTAFRIYFIAGTDAQCDYGRWNDMNNYVAYTGHVICSTNDSAPELVMAGPVFTENIGGWASSGMAVRPKVNITLQSFIFRNQGNADTIQLVNNSTGTVLQTVAVPAGQPNFVVTAGWALDAGVTYRIIAVAASNGRWVGYSSYPTSNDHLDVLGVSSGGSIITDYWFHFNDFTTIPR